jgi:xanthine dehydrogenase accessory factor
MSMDVYDHNGVHAKEETFAYSDNILPDLASWKGRGDRCALITLIGVDGNAPRAEGAQMAVSESGQWTGYISGGCLEQAIALEAAEVIKAGKPRLLRYGKGSPYFDIRLPCGSGLDVFVQPFDNSALIHDMRSRSERREPFVLRIGLSSGTAKLESLDGAAGASSQPLQTDGEFLRLYLPPLRCLIIGSSPIAVKLAELSACTGFETVFYALDIESLPPLPGSVKAHRLAPGTQFSTDAWTAAILAFHDHEQELPVFSELLTSPCFFIGAIGSRNAQAARVLALDEQGFSQEEIARIESPAGLVPGLKSAPLVALSILSQVAAKAKEQHIIL